MLPVVWEEERETSLTSNKKMWSKNKQTESLKRYELKGRARVAPLWLFNSCTVLSTWYVFWLKGQQLNLIKSVKIQDILLTEKLMTLYVSCPSFFFGACELCNINSSICLLLLCPLSAPEFAVWSRSVSRWPTCFRGCGGCSLCCQSTAVCSFLPATTGRTNRSSSTRTQTSSRPSRNMNRKACTPRPRCEVRTSRTRMSY